MASAETIGNYGGLPHTSLHGSGRKPSRKRERLAARRFFLKSFSAIDHQHPASLTPYLRLLPLNAGNAIRRKHHSGRHASFSCDALQCVVSRLPLPAAGDPCLLARMRCLQPAHCAHLLLHLFQRAWLDHQLRVAKHARHVPPRHSHVHGHRPVGDGGLHQHQ